MQIGVANNVDNNNNNNNKGNSYGKTIWSKNLQHIILKILNETKATTKNTKIWSDKRNSSFFTNSYNRIRFIKHHHHKNKNKMKKNNKVYQQKQQQHWIDRIALRLFLFTLFFFGLFLSQLLLFDINVTTWLIIIADLFAWKVVCWLNLKLYSLKNWRN